MASRRKQSKPKSFADADPLLFVENGASANIDPLNVNSDLASNGDIKQEQHVKNENVHNTLKNVESNKKHFSEAIQEENASLHQNNTISIATLKRKREEDDAGINGGVSTSSIASSSGASGGASVSSSSSNDIHEIDDIQMNEPSAKMPAILLNETNNNINNSENDQIINDYSNLVEENDNENDEDDEEEDSDMMLGLDASSSNYLLKGYNFDSPSLNGEYLGVDEEEDDEDLNDTGGDLLSKTYGGEDDQGQIVSSMLLQFKCKVCGKGFKHRRSLNRHVKLHSGEKNFICPYCTTAFARSDHLKAHIRTHNNSKPYRCPICQCGYSTQAALKVHMAHHHSKSKFKCVLCNNLEFHSQLALEGHIYTKHSKENNDLNELINETRGRYSQPVKLEFSNKLDSSLNTGSSTSASNNNVNNSNNNNMSGGHHSTDNYSQYNNSNNDNQMDNEVNVYNYNRSRLIDINNIKELNNDPNTNNSNYVKDNNNSHNNNHNTNHENEHNNQNSHQTTSPASKQKQQVNESNKTSKNFTQDQDEDDDIIIEEESTNTSPSKVAIPSSQKTGIAPINALNGPQNNKIPIPPFNPQHQLKRIVPKIDGVGVNGRPIGPPQISQHPLQTNSNHISRLLSQQQPSQVSNAKNVYINGHNNPNYPPSNHQQRPINGSNHPQLHSHLNGPPTSTSAIVPGSTGLPNTYCELCNARFSNPESYIAHMRHCHPNIPFNLNQESTHSNAKMPYLTSILSSKSNQLIKSNGPTSTVANGSVIIPINGSSSKPPAPICNVPNCNCANSINGQSAGNYTLPPQSLHHYGGPQDNDLYILKETHYTCVQCSVTFVKLNDYMTHLKHEHCVEVFRCILCKQMQLFDNLNLLKEHFFQVHQSHKYDLYKCKLCVNNNNGVSANSSNTLFHNVEDLYSHLQNVHHQNPRPVNPNASTSSTASSSGPPPPPSHIYQPGGPPLPAASYPNHHFPPTSSQPPPHMLPPHASNGPDRFHYSTNNSNGNNKCFKCNYCESDFAQQNSLNQHIQMVHKINPNNEYRSNNFYTNQSNSVHSQHHPHHPSPHHLPHHSQSHSQPTNHPQSLSCQYCRNTFTNRSQLERHLRIHLSSIDLKCNICDRLFDNQDTLSQHKLTHCKTYDMESPTIMNKQPVSNIAATSTNTSAAICVYCKQTIENEIQFKEHFKRHNNIGIQNQSQNAGTTKTNSFICIVCRQTLTSNSEYNLHMKHHLRRLNQNQTQNQVKPHNPQSDEVANTSTATTNKLKCSKCLVKFEVWQELVDHMSKAHNIRTASSSSLSSSSPSPSIKSTTSNSSLPTSSINNNDSIKQEPVVNNVQQLKSNKPTIMPNNDYLCEICSSKFDTQSKLQAHLLLKHEFQVTTNSSGVGGQQQPQLPALVCPVCDESFSRADHLLQHTLIHGQAAKIYKCTQCPLAFVFKSQLINHSFAHQNHQIEHRNSSQINNNKLQNQRSNTIGPHYNSNSKVIHANNTQGTTLTKIAQSNTQPLKQPVQREQQEHQVNSVESDNQVNEINDDYQEYNNEEETEDQGMYPGEEVNYEENNQTDENLEINENNNYDENNQEKEQNVDEENRGDLEMNNEYPNEDAEDNQNYTDCINEQLEQHNENTTEKQTSEEDFTENINNLNNEGDTEIQNNQEQDDQQIENNQNEMNHLDDQNDEAANMSNFNAQEEEFILNDNDDDIDNLN